MPGYESIDAFIDVLFKLQRFFTYRELHTTVLISDLTFYRAQKMMKFESQLLSVQQLASPRLALSPGHSPSKSDLVSTVFACVKYPMKSWGIVLHVDTAGLKLLFSYVSIYVSVSQK